MISGDSKETLLDFYKLAHRRYSLAPVNDSQNELGRFFARESIDALLNNNYAMAVELSIHAELLDVIWLDYTWLLQVEYAEYINNVYTAKPLSTASEYVSMEL